MVTFFIAAPRDRRVRYYTGFVYLSPALPYSIRLPPRQKTPHQRIERRGALEVHRMPRSGDDVCRRIRALCRDGVDRFGRGDLVGIPMDELHAHGRAQARVSARVSASASMLTALA
jgi:hypothetical protein